VRAVLGVEVLARRALALAGALALAAGFGGGALTQFLDDADDRLLDELAVDVEVGDERRGRLNSSRTPAARAWSISASESRIVGGP
jgi:hypothetical protein